MKRKIEDLSDLEQRATLDALYTAASSVKGRDSMKLFLRDLLTRSERIMLGRRILIARMLISGEGYDSIGERLRVGSATIRRIDRWLADQFPGFENAIKDMESEFDRRKNSVSRPKTLIAKLKKRYPLHFLLFSNK